MSRFTTFAAPLRRATSTIVFALSVGALAACGDGPISPEVASLATAQALWNRTKPASGSYTIEQQVACFCSDGATKYQVTVTRGIITRVLDPEAASDLPASQFSRFRTIDQLFDAVRSVIQKTGVLIAVEYDRKMGFPTTVHLDPIKNAVDDEVAYYTSHFVVSS